MAVRTPRFFLVPIIILAGCHQEAQKPVKPTRQPQDQKEAAKRFADFVKDGSNLKANGKDVENSFYDCFVEGLPFTEGEALLSTAMKEENGAETIYTWVFTCEINGRLDGFALHVTIHDGPAGPGNKVVKNRYSVVLPA